MLLVARAYIGRYISCNSAGFSFLYCLPDHDGGQSLRLAVKNQAHHDFALSRTFFKIENSSLAQWEKLIN